MHQSTAGETILPEAEAERFYSVSDAAHDFDHVRRVTHLAVQIAQAEGADLTVVRLAALLHDVPVPDDAAPDDAAPETLRQAHHMAAAAYARDILAARGVGSEQVENVVHSIQAHRFRDRSMEPETLEAQCLYDADKLDSIGAIGIGRAFAFAGAHGHRLWIEPWTEAPPGPNQPTGADYTPVHEYVYKLRRILDALHTASARRIGHERHQFMQVFFDRLDAEMQDQS